MKEKGRDGRYVVSTRRDGTFIVNFFLEGQLIEEGIEHELTRLPELSKATPLQHFPLNSFNLDELF